MGEEADSRVLDQLQPNEGVGSDTSEEEVSVVDAGGYEGVDEGERGRV